MASGSKAAGLRQFSKVRSSKRDVVDRCTFHCCCTLLQLCMLQKFEFYPNCRMRKCESVFIKTLRPSWSYISIGPATFCFVKKILFTMCTAAVHFMTFRLAFYWRIEVWIILLINLAWDYPHNELLVTFLIRNRTYEHFSPHVQFFSTKVLHTRLSVGGVSLLENWILEGDEQGNFPVNAFVFLFIVFGFIFLEQSYDWMIQLTCY